MSLRLRPLAEQVVVITGGSSGIGLATARMAAARGAQVVIAARNADALRAAVGEMQAQGGRAAFCAADVADRVQVDAIAATALARFGRIDSWVNGAAAATYGDLTEIAEDDHRRVFDVTYWGQVHGSLTAVRHMRRRGGALVNIGSILGDIAVPLQGAYVAAKHAVKGFTEALRMEIARDGVPVSVSLIKPASIDTPYMEHARAYVAEAPLTPPPRYAPEVVARAILHCCETPTRELYVGGTGRALVALARTAPALYEAMARSLYAAQLDPERGADADADRRDNLYRPRSDGSAGSRTAHGHARGFSLYTELAMRPWATAGALTGLALAIGAAVRARR